MTKDLKHQIKYVYLYTFFTGMMFWYGIEQLFLNEIGDGVFVRGVVLAVFSVTMLLTNIPAGAISDIWGRVRSLKLALLFLTVSLVILGLSQNVWQYAIGYGINALFWSFDEGAKEAFVYDSLVDSKQEKQYQRILGRIYAALLIGATVANVSSGFIGDVLNLRSTFLLSLLPAAVAWFYILKLHEPEHHKQAGKKLFKQLGDAFKAMRASSVLSAIVIGQLLLYTVMTIAGEFSQVALVEHTSSPIVFGLAWALLSLMMAASNALAHRVKHVFWFFAGLLALLLGYYLTRNVWGSLISLFIFVTGLEVISIKGEGALQKVTPSKLRATISSIPGSGSMLLVAVLAVWVGQSTDSIAVRVFALCMPMSLVVFTIWLRHRTIIPRD